MIGGVGGELGRGRVGFLMLSERKITCCHFRIRMPNMGDYDFGFLGRGRVVDDDRVDGMKNEVLPLWN